MRTYVYTPSQCKDQKDADGNVVEHATFSGEVVLRIPSYEDRLEALANHPEILETESTKKKNGAGVSMKAILTMVKWSYSFYKKVDLIRLSDGYKMTSLDDLRHDASCQGLIQDIAGKLSSGFELGK